MRSTCFRLLLPLIVLAALPAVPCRAQGFGAEMRLGRHAGLHADYRYTFLHFGADDSLKSGLTSPKHGLLGASASSFLPSYEGSMWTAGLTVYF